MPSLKKIWIVRHFQGNYLKEEMSEFHSRARFVIFELNLITKALKSKRPQNGTRHYKIIQRVKIATHLCAVEV